MLCKQEVSVCHHCSAQLLKNLVWQSLTWKLRFEQKSLRCSLWLGWKKGSVQCVNFQKCIDFSPARRGGSSASTIGGVLEVDGYNRQQAKKKNAHASRAHQGLLAGGGGEGRGALRLSFLSCFLQLWRNLEKMLPSGGRKKRKSLLSSLPPPPHLPPPG